MTYFTSCVAMVTALIPPTWNFRAYCLMMCFRKARWLARLLFNRIMFVGMWVGLSVKNIESVARLNSANHDLHDLKQNLTVVQTADVLSKWLKESPAVSVLNKILSFLGFRRYSFVFKKNACLWFVCMCSNIVYQRHNWG